MMKTILINFCFFFFLDDLNAALAYTKASSGFENSADENAQKEQKLLKRKHPINSILPDLSQTIKVKFPIY